VSEAGSCPGGTAQRQRVSGDDVICTHCETALNPHTFVPLAIPHGAT